MELGAVSKGCFSVKEAYSKLVKNLEAVGPSNDQEKMYNFLWKSYAPRRVQTIVWKVLKMGMPTRESLKRTGVITDQDDTSCAFCGETTENISHLFFTCRFGSQIWSNLLKWLNISNFTHLSMCFTWNRRHGSICCYYLGQSDLDNLEKQKRTYLQQYLYGSGKRNDRVKGEIVVLNFN